ncbi:NADPH-dependent glutamate synthase [Vallitaleaceae bacterium 9-2]
MSSLVKTPIHELDPLVRNQTFDEVVTGYTLEEAMKEANRCLECKHAPCMKGCPVNVRIPEFIHEVKEGNIQKAYEILVSENRLPAICGRVCPQENQCEGKCVRGIKGEPVAIGRLERFVADTVEGKAQVLDAKSLKKTLPYKVAVIGSGPAGLTCAAELAQEGIQVTLYEALHKIGGVLTYGIPEFRLPKALIEKEKDKLVQLGVEIKTDTLIGRSYTIDQLKEMGFDAVFIGSGAGLPRFMNIPGESLNGVYSANEYLTRVNLMKAYEEDARTPIKKSGNVVVIGGGNVAMDAARTAKRLGADQVSVVYRRSLEELPARAEEIHHAMEEEIEFNTLWNPVEIIGDGINVTAIQCQKMELGEADASGRRRPVPVENSYKEIPCDTVIIAIGQTPNPLIKMSTPGIETYDFGGIKVNEETMETNMPLIYAGGDAVTGAATVIKAMGAGKVASKEILKQFIQKN